MKTYFLDYQIFQIPDLEKFFENLSGSNEQAVLVAFFDEKQEPLTDFLKKIITAVKLDLAKDCLVCAINSDTLSQNVPKASAIPRFSSLKSIGKIEKALIFGVHPEALGLHISPPQYQAFFFNNCTFLFADKLSVLEKSPEKKKRLWDGLRDLFL